MSDEKQAAEETKPEAKAEGETTSAAADEPKTSVQGEPAADKQAEAAASAAAEDDDGAVLDASGRERPRFLLAFPEDPDLKRLSAAFEAGNYALVRAEADALAERTQSPAVRDAALELRRRIEPDPLAKYLLALTAALLLSLAYFAYHH